jgi:hypothetical protein
MYQLSNSTVFKKKDYIPEGANLQGPDFEHDDSSDERVALQIARKEKRRSYLILSLT